MDLPFRLVPRKSVAAWIAIAAASLLAIVVALTLRIFHTSAQDFPVVIGRIEGDDLSVVTTTPAGIETDAAPTVVASGSDVTLHSGHGLLLLNGGGEISVCGPAHFKLIRASGAVTLALDYGRVHPSLDTADTFTIYTPTIVATPIAIAGGRREMTVGLDQSGEMCVLTAHGAMRVEPQFSDQSLIIPQGGTVSLSGGQIDSLQADASACSCEYPRARREAPPVAPPPAPATSPQPARDIGALAPPLAPQHQRINNSPPPAAPASEPVYTVLMPPLTFDANSPQPPPEPAPETILLVRETRLRPSVEFRGHVNPAPTPPPAPAAAVTRTPPPSGLSDDHPPKAPPGLLDRVRIFIRRLTNSGQGPCAGVGCDG